MGSGRTAVNTREPSVGADGGQRSGHGRLTCCYSFLLAQTASRAALYITDWQLKSDQRFILEPDPYPGSTCQPARSSLW